MAQTWTNLSRTGLVEKSDFFVRKIKERESFFSTGAFSMVEMQVIPLAEWAKPDKKARVDLSRNIIQKKIFPTMSAHCAAQRKEAELFYPSTTHHSPAVVFGWSVCDH